MFPTAMIVFREFLEIALVLTIIAAATQGLANRWWLISLGLLLGALGSGIIALFTDSISMAIDGMGQEVFNACIMFAAVGLLSWTIIWMRLHGQEMAQKFQKVGHDVLTGTRPPYAIIAIVALASLREGAEIVLFTYGMALSGQFPITNIVIGGVIGALGGTIVGILFYYGLLKAAKKHLLAITGWLLVFLTAGMAAQGASFLIAADILPAITFQLWDSSALISGNSFMGQLLNILIGYTPKPTGMEAIFYLTVIGTVGLFYATYGKQSAKTVTVK